MFGGKKVREQEAEIAKLKSQISDLERNNSSLTSQLEEAQKQLLKVKSDFDSAVIQENFVRQDNLRLNKRVAELSSAERRAAEAAEILRTVTTKLSEWIFERIVNNVKAGTLDSSTRQMKKVISYCSNFVTNFDPDLETRWIKRLEEAHNEAVRKEMQRQEQLLIKEQMREEKRAERERKDEMERLLRDENRIKDELEKLLLRRQTEESERHVEELKLQLEAAHQKRERAISQAQMTRAGHVYVISNVGSFGEGIFKIGMTRRLFEYTRIRELSGAAVPFPFDVHMMISSEDAPALETELHRMFHHTRVNKINLRREFFRVSLDDIRRVVEEKHGEVQYEAAAAAFEYNKTIELEKDGFTADFAPEANGEDDDEGLYEDDDLGDESA